MDDNRQTGAARRTRILAVDIGTGTQDILLFEGGQTIENCLQLIMPSPTVIYAERIRRATAERRPVLLTGRTMGGGPVSWAARDHAQAGLPCYATPDAARTLDDDLTRVSAQGLRVIAEDEVAEVRAEAGPTIEAVELRDFDPAAIQTALRAFGVDPRVDALALAAFDHGAAPPDISDRRFRFDLIAERIRARPDPLALAYLVADLPPSLTRLAAVAAEAAEAAEYDKFGKHKSSGPIPLVLMDTGAAALAGALEDPVVRGQRESLIVNIGNFHTLAFHLRGGRILGTFEHHTGELTTARLENYLRALVGGTLTNERVFAESGHGALLLEEREPRGEAMPFVAVTGPRRELLRGSDLEPYEAVPHGDMMLAGCYGLLRAVEVLLPRFAPAIVASLGGR